MDLLLNINEVIPEYNVANVETQHLENSPGEMEHPFSDIMNTISDGIVNLDQDIYSIQEINNNDNAINKKIFCEESIMIDKDTNLGKENNSEKKEILEELISTDSTMSNKKYDFDSETNLSKDKVINENPLYLSRDIYFNLDNSFFKNTEIRTNKLDSVQYSLDTTNQESTEKIILTNLKNSIESKHINDISLNELNSYENIESERLDFLETDFKASSKEVTIQQSQEENQINNSEVSKENILKQIKEGLNSNSTSRNIQILLKPHTLGKVNFNLKFYNNTLHVNIFVENNITEEVLKQSLSEVAHIINSTGDINIGKINITKNDETLDESIEGVNSIEKLVGRYLGPRIIARPKGIYQV